jgi:hypothetical protein
MPDTDSGGAKAMRDLSRRLRDYAAEMGGEPNRQFDLRMASELLEHLAVLTTKLARPTDVPLHSEPRP